MKRTTIVLEDEVYKKLVKEALERYGSTRKLSLLINEKLKKMEKINVPKKRKTFRFGKSLTLKQIEKKIEEGLEEVAG